MSKSKLNTSKLSDKLQLSTKVDSKERFRKTISNPHSPKSFKTLQSKSKEILTTHVMKNYSKH